MTKMRAIVTLLIAALLASCRIDDAGSNNDQAATFRDPKTGTTIAVLVNATPAASPGPELNFAQETFAALAKVVDGR